MISSTGKLVCVGASAGGITATKALLRSIPSTFGYPIVFVQHIKSDSQIDFDLIFGDSYFGKIVEVNDKTPIEPETAYFSPAGYHVLIEKDWSFALTQEAPVCHSRPSINVFFESALNALGGTSLIGIVLTGANEDGAEGLRQLENSGAMVIAQDPKEAEYPFMPEQAIRNTKSPKVAKLDEMIALIHSNFKEGHL